MVICSRACSRPTAAAFYPGTCHYTQTALCHRLTHPTAQIFIRGAPSNSYNRFFSLNASDPLGVDEGTRLAVETNICREGGVDENCFKNATHLVLTALQQYYFPNFWKSEVRVNLCSLCNLKYSDLVLFGLNPAAIKTFYRFLMLTELLAQEDLPFSVSCFPAPQVFTQYLEGATEHAGWLDGTFFLCLVHVKHLHDDINRSAAPIPQRNCASVKG